MKTILVDAGNTFVTDEGVNKEMKKILDGFKNRKIIVTNATAEERITYKIVNMPYEVYSLEHKPNKTDPEYFKKFFKHFSLSVDKVVYFEHNPEAVKAAQSLGIKSFWYDKDKKDVKSLKKFLEANL